MSARPPLVVVDSREQRPLRPFVWRIVKGIAIRCDLATETRGLDTGDYSLAGLERVVTIERKSVGDLWQTLFGTDIEPTALGEERHNIDTFRAELHRMIPFARKWILLECTRGSLLAYAQERYERARGRGRAPEQNVNAICDMLASFEVDYGVSVQWAGGRDGAEAWAGRVLARVWSEATGGDKARTARGRGLSAVELPWLDALAEEDKNGNEEQSGNVRLLRERRAGRADVRALGEGHESPRAGGRMGGHLGEEGNGSSEGGRGEVLCGGDAPMAQETNARRVALAPAGGMTSSSSEYRRRRAART